MQTKVVKLDTTKVDTAKVKEAAETIDAGGLVVFPTETVYGIACRVQTDSLNKLDNLKGRASGKHYTLHIGQKSDLKKYVPNIGMEAEKLLKTAWPGPLTIVFELSDRDIKKQQDSLDKEIFENLYKNNSIGIRQPDNAIASALLQLTHNPVVAPSANITGQRPAVTAVQALAQLSGQIDVLLDAGACKYQKSSTVVKIGKKGLQVLRPGVYSRSELEKMAEVKFLFVCTGNTCRSPMAEGLFRKYLAEKLGCKVDCLSKIGYKVASAGVMGVAGLPASPEAIEACAVKGIDIRSHKSSVLSEQFIREFDFIFAMSRLHLERIVSLVPEAAEKCVLLTGNEDIPDPIGRPQEVYTRCAELIERAVVKKLGEFLI